MEPAEDLTRLLNQFPGIDTFYQLAQSLITFDNLPDLLRAVVDGVCVGVNPSWVLLVTFDVAKQQILDCVQGGPDADPDLDLSFDMVRDISRAHLWNPGERATLLDRENLLLRAEALAFSAQLTRDFNSAIAAPLLYQNEMIGLLAAARSADRAAFAEQDAVFISAIANQAAAAIENFWLLASLNQEKTQLELLYRLGQHLSRSLDIHDVCRLALDEICAAFGGLRGLLFVMEEGTETMQLMAQVGFDDIMAQFLTRRFRVGEGLTGWVAEHRQLAMIDDVTADPRWILTSKDDGIRSGVSVPLLSGEDLIGVMTLSFPRRAFFTPEYCRLLESAAATIAIAMSNARLFSKVQQLFRAEQRQREVAERLQATALVVNTLDLQEVLTLIMDQLESIFPYDSGSIQILEQDALCVIAERNAPHAFLGHCYPLKDHPYNRRLAEGEVVVIQDVQQDDMGWAPFSEAFYTRSNIGVPLWVRDKVIGALTIDHKGTRVYTDADIRVVQMFAQQAAIALENARLFEAQRVQRELAEALEMAAAVVSSVLDIDQVLDYILDQVARFVQGDTYNIILIEGDVGRMIRWRGYAEHGISMPAQGRDNIPIMTYPSLLQMIEDGRPTFVADTKHDPRWRIVNGQEPLNSYVAAPICIAGKTEGFINVAGLSPNQFGPQEAQRLKAFADHASIALQNARLFQQTLHHAEQLERRVRERTAELEAKNVWLEAVLSSTSDGIVVTDSDGQIADANRVARMWLYHSLPELDVARLRETIRDLARRADTRPDAVLELTGLDLELSASPIFGAEGIAGPASVVVIHDVSYLKALDRVKSQFVSNISHELRTPLTSIRLYSSLLQRNIPENSGRYFAALDGEVERISKLVDDILQISRIEAGQLELNRRIIDLNVLTEMAVMSHKVLAESRGLSLTYQAAREKTLVSVDHDKFVQVVNNLIENAINYTYTGGHIQVIAKRRIKDAREWATVMVTDSGMGIPEHEIHHLFERFFRGGEPQELRIQGSGLGLAIVKEIVELHGGAVTVESQVDIGSTFTLWLPLMED